jgi:predicted DNA-binding transcriptional regulator YafY
MATNKNALMRYKLLDSCFRNPGKRYYIQDLIDECSRMISEINPKHQSISRKQIFDDILFMESNDGWNIPLERIKDGKKVYYRYSDLNFSINNMPLNDLEIGLLNSALSILSQFKGMPQFGWIQDLVPKLQQGIISSEPEETIIEFDNNEYLKGIEHIGPLYNAILYKQVLKVQYQPYENENAFELTFHPYFLKQYNNRWFVYGYNPEHDKYDWNLALDRINKIEEVKGRYKKNTKIDWKEYFDDFMGVTKPEDGKLETIVLRFKGRTGKYMETKPIHGSQHKATWIDKDTLELSLKLLINFEFERFLMSYSDTVELISPEYLKAKIKERLKVASLNFK